MGLGSWVGLGLGLGLRVWVRTRDRVRVRVRVRVRTRVRVRVRAGPRTTDGGFSARVARNPVHQDELEPLDPRGVRAPMVYVLTPPAGRALTPLHTQSPPTPNSNPNPNPVPKPQNPKTPKPRSVFKPLEVASSKSE